MPAGLLKESHRAGRDCREILRIARNDLEMHSLSLPGAKLPCPRESGGSNRTFSNTNANVTEQDAVNCVIAELM